MCDPECRGAFSLSNDVYALGVLSIGLLKGSLPDIELTKEEINYEKLKRGSYSVFLQNLEHLETLNVMLHGLLGDNEWERWTIYELKNWLEGKSIRPRTGTGDRHATRPIEFNKVKNNTAETLTYSLTQKWPQALEFFKTDKIFNWLKYSIGDPKKSDDVENLVGSRETLFIGNDFQKNALMAKLLLTLSNKMPLFWPNIHITPGALGTKLAISMVEKKDTYPITAIIHARLPQLWYDIQQELSNKPFKVNFNFDTFPRILDRKRIGYGIEAVLYAMNPHLPCLSPHVINDYVTDIDVLLPALEKKAKTTSSPEINLLDEHVVAFIMSKTHIFRDNDLRGLIVADPLKQALMRLKFFAKIQERFSKEPTPSIASYIYKLTKPILNKYHHIPTKKWLEEECQKKISQGNLSALRNLIDDTTRLENDGVEFEKAKYYYQTIIYEIYYITESIIEGRSVERDNASKIYAVRVASGLAFFSFVAYLTYYYLL